MARARFRRSLGLMAVFSLMSNLLLLVMPLYMLQIYDRVLPSQSRETLLYLSLIAGFSLCILGFLEAIRTILATRAAAVLDVMLAEPVVRHVFSQAAGGVANTQPVRDVGMVRNALASRVIFNLLDLPFAVVFVIILYLIHPTLFWIALVGMAVLLALSVGNDLATRASNREQGEKDLAASAQLESYARNADTIMAMGMQNETLNRWGGIHAEALTSTDKSARTNAWFTGISRTIRFGLQVGILGTGAVLVLAGEMTAGMIFASSLIAGRAFQPVDQTIASWRNLIMLRQSWNRLVAFLADYRTEEDMTRLPRPSGNLGIEGIFVPSFGNPSEAPILNNINFELSAGSVLAIVGPSGSGKSTLARVMVGLLEPIRGEVRLDGYAISQWMPSDRGLFVGYLPQTVDLLPGTIGQNIARFRGGADDGALFEAARLAKVEPLIAHLPNGYNTAVGTGGVQLSGGEKQRLALARAFFGNPALVVLDEPNSNLDLEGEKALAEALASARKAGMTVVIITQRHHILKHVDKIMLLEKGIVSRFGDADEFLRPPENVTELKRPKKPGEGVTSRFVQNTRASFGGDK